MLTRKQMRAYATKQKIKLIFDARWNLVKGVRPDGSIAFDTVVYEIEEQMLSGEEL